MTNKPLIPICAVCGEQLSFDETEYDTHICPSVGTVGHIDHTPADEDERLIGNPSFQTDENWAAIEPLKLEDDFGPISDD